MIYFFVLVGLLVIDLPWLGWVTQPLYQQGIGHLMAPTFSLPAAVAFYLIYAAGLVYFAGLGASSARHAAVRGAIEAREGHTSVASPALKPPPPTSLARARTLARGRSRCPKRPCPCRP